MYRKYAEDLNFECLQLKENTMKILFLSIAATSAATALVADDVLPPPQKDVSFAPIKRYGSTHAITPTVKYINHSENNFDFSKILSGFEYSFGQSEGINFNAFMGYSVGKHRGYFAGDWHLKYLVNFDDSTNFYPVIGLSHAVHFINNRGTTFHVYRTSFNGGIGGIYEINQHIILDGYVAYSKDIGTSVALVEGDKFWGTIYRDPHAAKVGLNVKMPTLLDQAIVVGGYYSRTFNSFYKEFGINAAIEFNF